MAGWLADWLTCLLECGCFKCKQLKGMGWWGCVGGVWWWDPRSTFSCDVAAKRSTLPGPGTFGTFGTSVHYLRSGLPISATRSR